ncbi:MAG: hypothetical protein Q4F88_03165 [Eubacteriales bacterium]|nr:hypothetical protein [Eubacteriales bacterium]
MNTVEASIVMSIIIFSIMYMITFSFGFARKTNTFIKSQIDIEHIAYTKGNKKFYPDEALRALTILDSDEKEEKSTNENEE